MKPVDLALLTLTVLLLTAAVAEIPGAQAAPPSDWTPIDQSVSDLDPLAVSLRRVNAGLRADGEQTSLFAPPPSLSRFGQLPRPAYFYRVGPGFRARVERLHYLVPMRGGGPGLDVAGARDGQFIELPSTNMVFELAPLPAATARSADPPHRQANDLRIDARVDGRVDARVR